MIPNCITCIETYLYVNYLTDSYQIVCYTKDNYKQGVNQMFLEEIASAVITLAVSFTVSLITKDVVMATYNRIRWGGWRIVVVKDGNVLLNWPISAETNQQLKQDPANGTIVLRRAVTHCGERYTSETTWTQKYKSHMIIL